METFTHGSLFSGIGGFDLAAQWMGWKNLFHCEWNEFGQKVLKHYWPDAELFSDITKSDFTKYANRIDVLTGGFPCQPYSAAGKRLGKDDERHLWPQMLRAIREVRPRYVVGENVRGLTNWNGGVVFNEVQADLETQGYEVLPFLLPACAVNAPHRRDRIWFIAYSSRFRNSPQGKSSGFKSHGSGNNGKPEEWIESTERIDRSHGFLRTTTNADDKLFQRWSNEIRPETAERYFGTPFQYNAWQNFPTQSPICSGDDGLPSELDGITFPKWRNESIKAYGNAIVPQVAFEIFKAIQQTDNLTQ
jgi:DNA (cytosine-5)-methyltransferase 1